MKLRGENAAILQEFLWTLVMFPRQSQYTNFGVLDPMPARSKGYLFHLLAEDRRQPVPGTAGVGCWDMAKSAWSRPQPRLSR
jgi:hypothetical protein